MFVPESYRKKERAFAVVFIEDYKSAGYKAVTENGSRKVVCIRLKTGCSTAFFTFPSIFTAITLTDRNMIFRRFVLLLLSIFVSATLPRSAGRVWETVETTGTCTKRHECAMTAVDGKLCLLGGRGIKPAELLDTKHKTWAKLADSPQEMHHFQAITYNNEAWVLGAFTGGYPHEQPIGHAWIFNPEKNEWRKGPDIPKARQRGAAGVSVYKNKIYLVSGITDGHWDGHVPWFDVYDPQAGRWEQLPDVPHPRDHFQTTVLDDKLYVAGGRRSSAKIDRVFQLTVPEVDVYDFKTGRWSTLPPEQNLPTLRAGSSTVAFGKKVVVIGGESSQKPAHNQVEAYNTKTKRWENLPALNAGRHGMQAVVLNGKIYIASGSGNQGGGPELASVEKY
jgi:N-acetylneuraminic acid mutarotase